MYGKIAGMRDWRPERWRMRCSERTGGSSEDHREVGGQARRRAGQEADRSRPRLRDPIGKKQKALEWLGRAFDQQDPQIVWMKIDPRVKSLRGDPQFEAYMKRSDCSRR